MKGSFISKGVCNFNENGLYRRCFPLNFVEFSKTAIPEYICDFGGVNMYIFW